MFHAIHEPNRPKMKTSQPTTEEYLTRLITAALRYEWRHNFDAELDLDKLAADLAANLVSKFPGLLQKITTVLTEGFSSLNEVEKTALIKLVRSDIIPRLLAGEFD